MVDLDGFVLRLVLLVPIACATASSGEDQELDAEDLAADAPEESPPPNVAAASEAAIDVSDASPELVEAEQTRQPGSCDDQACAEGDNGKCCQKLSIIYEFEMLEARARGDKKAEREYGERLETARRLACESGIEVQCGSLEER